MALDAIEILQDIPELLSLINKGTEVAMSQPVGTSALDRDLNVAEAIFPGALALIRKIEAQLKS